MATIDFTKVSVAVLVVGFDCRLSGPRHDQGGGMVSGAIHVSTLQLARQADPDHGGRQLVAVGRGR